MTVKAHPQRILFNICAAFFINTFAVAIQAKDNFQFSGYANSDHNAFEGSLFDADDSSDLQNLKVSIKYKYSDTISAKSSVEYNSADGKFALDDAYIKFSMFERWELQAGKFKEPFGMENQQSSTTQYAIERSAATNAFTFGRNPGLQLAYERKRWQWQLAATNNQAKDKDYKDSIAYTTRISGLPIATDNFFVHLGAGFTSRDALEDKYDIDESIIAVGAGNSIGSPKLKAKSIRGSNLEFAARYDHLVLQSEYFVQDIVERKGDHHQFFGYYNTLLWTAIGSKRDYDSGTIEFDDSARHTLEFVLRSGYIDLESQRLKGDRAEFTSATINYYFKGSLRVSLEYEHADLLRFDDGDTVLLDGNSFNTRLQFAF